MRIIDEETDARDRDRYDIQLEWPIVRRIIHSTADFDFSTGNRIVFHEDAVKSGMDALKGGCSIVVDVNGVLGGMNKQNLADFANKTICNISRLDVMSQAMQSGTMMTRSQTSMRISAPDIDGGIVAIGNAPTALREVMSMVREGVCRPALVIGIPVGFVGAAESKEELARGMRFGGGTGNDDGNDNDSIPFITNVGRKGGSPAASAIINALFKLVRQKDADA